MAELIFWIGVCVLVYVYAGFPVLVAVAGTLRDRRVRRQDVTPTLTLIVTAFNEEQHIRGRLENALALDYPKEAMEIIVASDGSTDRTVEVAAEFRTRGVKVLPLPRRGKIHALNTAVAYARGEILVFSDATSIYRVDALRKLARNFADPEVGGVSGTPHFVVSAGSESTARGERVYFSYDNLLKSMESRTGSIVSAAGCIFAIRRTLYQPIPPDVTDDFAISTGVIERGKRLVWEPEAIAFEEAAAHKEFRRKVRMMTRGFRSLIFRRRLLNPFRYGSYSVILFSHKLMRRLLPILLLVLFSASIAAQREAFVYRLALAGQVLFYALALAGLSLTRTSVGGWKVFSIPFFYCMANAASLIALCNVLCGSRIELWQPQRHSTTIFR